MYETVEAVRERVCVCVNMLLHYCSFGGYQRQPRMGSNTSCDGDGDGDGNTCNEQMWYHSLTDHRWVDLPLPLSSTCPTDASGVYHISFDPSRTIIASGIVLCISTCAPAG
jgi:hypothetical protein